MFKAHLDDYGAGVLEKAKETGANAYYFKIKLDDNCVMKSVRAFMVFNNLEKMGDIIKSIPHTQEIEDENFDKEIIVYFVSEESLAKVKDAINNISEITVVEECEFSELMK
jgi:two-component system chemotaxis sensor kinase CheA